MSRLDLPEALHRAVDDTTSTQDPHAAWVAGRRRTRLTAGLTAAAAVAAISVTAGGVHMLPTGSDGAPQPAQRPTTTNPTTPTTPTASNTLRFPDRPEVRIDRAFDPADWSSLPEYPVDLGTWTSPERPVPLEPGSIERARTAISFETTPTQSNLLVIDDVGQWFSVDTQGIEFANSFDISLGLSRRSLSPDGTHIAIGQAGGVVVIDLTTTEARTYPIADLPPVASGREVSWDASGDTVLLAQTASVRNGNKGAQYPHGYKVDLATGVASRLDYDPEHAVTLTDGTVIANQWRQRDDVTATDTNGTRTTLDDVRRVLGAASNFAANTSNLWAVRREARTIPDLVDGVSGFMAYEGFEPLAALPVKGVENHGGGSQLIGWLTADHAVFSVPVDEIMGPKTDRGTVVWDAREGTLWRGPLTITNARVSVMSR